MDPRKQNKRKQTYSVRYVRASWAHTGDKCFYPEAGAQFASACLAWLKKGILTELKIKRNALRPQGRNSGQQQEKKNYKTIKT